KKLKLAKKYLGEPVVFRMTVVESRTGDKITWESDEIGPVEAAEAPEKPGDSDEDLEGKISVFPPTTLHPGQDFAVKFDDDLAGEKVSVWMFSKKFDLGTHTVGKNDRVSVTVPQNISMGAHKVA